MSCATICWPGVAIAPTAGSTPAAVLRIDGLGEVRGLLGTEPVGEPPLGERDVVVGDRLIARHVPDEPATVGEPHRQEVLPADHVGVVNRPVAGEATDAIKDLASCQVSLRHGEYVTHRLALRSDG